MTTEPMEGGVIVKVHHSKTACQSKSRHLVSDSWDKVTCSFCLKKTTHHPKVPLPEGVKRAADACQCKECVACRYRSRLRKRASLNG